MGALLALASALSYGVSDFLGGLASRRTSYVRVAIIGQIGGLIAMTASALTWPGIPAVTDLLWGGVSGLGTGMAMVFLFRGMSRGAMSVVVPTSAVGGVVIPVLVGVAVLGDRPVLLVWTGVVIAVPALWLVSRGPTAGATAPPRVIGDGLVSGAGIALQYLALAQAGPAAGIWPVTIGRVTAVLAVVVLTVKFRPAVDITRRADARTTVPTAALAGVLAGLALVCYLLATRIEMITLSVVLSSLYPVIPVLLGITLLHERLARTQIAGLAGAFVAVLLVATS